MKEQIMEILVDLRPDIDFEEETKLIDGHVLESFDIVALVAEIEEAFNVKVRPKDLTAQNFNSADAIIELVKRLQED